MDMRYAYGTEIYVVRACTCVDANDLVAFGGEHSVDVVLVTESSYRTVATFHVGTRITALAWSNATISPSTTGDWLIELAAAGSDYGLRLLSKSSSSDEHIFSFGGGLSGHHGKINDMAFCGGWGQDNSRYVGTVSDDKMLMVWDLQPTIDIRSSTSSPNMDSSPPAKSRPQPTAYAIEFSHPLVSISSHPTTNKEFLVSDVRGSLYLTDWRSHLHDEEKTYGRHSILLELVEPYALSSPEGAPSSHSTGWAAWRSDTTDIIGAVYGSRCSVWDVSNIRGGKPVAVVNTFPTGGNKFRWSQCCPELFAVSTQSPMKGAVIHVHNINFVQVQPTVLQLAPRPHFVRDFDFLSIRDVPWIVAVTGKIATFTQLELNREAR